jgi:outer membrane protein assembly factor BamB
MKFSISLIRGKQTASCRIVGLMLATAPLWLMLATANMSAHAQTSSAAAATGTTTSSPADWTEFHRDNMQRWNPYETVLGVNNVGELGLKWQFPISVGRSSPAVVNGVVYIGTDEAVESPITGLNEDWLMYALNASTGARLWSFVARYIVNSPAVANGVVYVSSMDYDVYALNATTGATLWAYATGSNVESSPAVANGVVYVGSNDGNVYALNASTGAKLWSYATGGPVEFSSPAVANGVVYFDSADNYVYALNASTGAKLWSYATGAGSSPAVVNGTLYIGSSAYSLPSLGSADLFLRIWPSPTTVHQGDLLTYAFPVWNLGPDNADLEVLNTQVPEGTTFDYIRISGTPGLGTCTHPPYQGTGQIVCHENASMAPATTWTVRLTVRVTAPSGTVITESGATLADNHDPNMANNSATVSTTVQ